MRLICSLSGSISRPSGAGARLVANALRRSLGKERRGGFVVASAFTSFSSRRSAILRSSSRQVEPLLGLAAGIGLGSEQFREPSSPAPRMVRLSDDPRPARRRIKHGASDASQKIVAPSASWPRASIFSASFAFTRSHCTSARRGIRKWTRLLGHLPSPLSCLSCV